MKKINVIIEGCDCTGKTTLARRVSSDLGFIYVKVQNPVDENDGSKMNHELLEMLNYRRGMVLDRGLLGESVYGPIIRGYSISYMRELEIELGSHVVLIVLTADTDTVLERFDDEFITKEQIPRILERFDAEFDASFYQFKLRIDTSLLSEEEVFCAVKQYIEYVTKELESDLYRG